MFVQFSQKSQSKNVERTKCTKHDLRFLLTFEVFGRGTSAIKISVLKRKGLNVWAEPPCTKFGEKEYDTD